MRWALLVSLFAAPLAMGSVHPPAYLPLLAVFYATGLASWARSRVARSLGEDVPPVPAARLLVALHALAALQLVPLPPALLRRVSPGSFAHHFLLNAPGAAWQPISVDVEATARGLVFLGGLSLLYATVFREFREPLWRRRLCGTLVAAGLTVAVVGLVQSASSDPGSIYGLWRPRDASVVFGPFVNRNHFGGYLALTVPVAAAFALDALQGAASGWKRRGWLSLLEGDANTALRHSAQASVIAVALLACKSRGAFFAFLVSALGVIAALPKRLTILLVSAGVAVPALTWLGLNGAFRGTEVGGFHASRGEFWLDTLQLVSLFPVLGCGFNAFEWAYQPYQRVWLWGWPNAVHNEFLQAALEMGIVGTALTAGLVWRLLRAAVAAARASALGAGVLGGVLAGCAHAFVDFPWQMPAIAATFVALAGLAVQAPEDWLRRARGDPAPLRAVQGSLPRVISRGFERVPEELPPVAARARRP